MIERRKFALLAATSVVAAASETSKAVAGPISGATNYAISGDVNFLVARRPFAQDGTPDGALWEAIGAVSGNMSFFANGTGKYVGQTIRRVTTILDGTIQSDPLWGPITFIAEVAAVEYEFSYKISKQNEVEIYVNPHQLFAVIKNGKRQGTRFKTTFKNKKDVPLMKGVLSRDRSALTLSTPQPIFTERTSDSLPNQVFYGCRYFTFTGHRVEA